MHIDKRKLRKILYAYITVMLVVIFSSKTIYNFSLPQITVAMPQSGCLTKEYESFGIIAFSETFDIYATSSGQINEIFISKGDIISPDTIVATCISETAGAGADAAEISVNIERIKNQLAALALSKAAIHEKLRALGASPDDFYSYQCAIEDADASLDRRLGELGAARELAEAPIDDHVMQQAIADAQIQWDEKQVDAENTQILYEEGAVALAEAISAKSAAEDAERAYIRAVDELERAKEKASHESRNRVSDAQIAVAEAKTALERANTNLKLAQAASKAQDDQTRQSLGLELKKADLDIERANIDLRAAEASLNRAKEASLNRAAEASLNRAAEASLNKDISKINAGCQGVVISVEKSRGQFVTQGEKIATVGVSANSFTSEITCTQSDGRFIGVGDEASITKSGSNAAVKAAVYDIAPLGDMLKICIVCETDEFKGGEYVNVKFKKQTQQYEIIVPNDAISKEGMNNYVWTVRSRQGALGMEYFTIKARVIIADSDDFHSAIARGLDTAFPAAPVVVESDKRLAANGRVRRLE